MNIIEKIIEVFDLDLEDMGDYFNGNCPIHPMSDSGSFVLYKKGYFKCYSRHCEEYFYGNLIGLVRGILSNRQCGWSGPGDQMYPYSKALEVFKNLGGQKIKYNNDQRDTLDFIRRRRQKLQHTIDIIPEFKLEIPSKYFLKRGFKKRTLEWFGVGDYIGDGLCKNRAVVPVYSEDGKKIGWTARSHFKPCLVCKLHHGHALCPSKKNYGMYEKWIHSKGLRTRNLLYNYNNAYDETRKKNHLIIVESPGNTWKLWENGIKNVVGLFGTNLDLRQQSLIYRIGIDNITLCLDNDGAGYDAIDRITAKLQDFFNVEAMSLENNNDLAELQSHELQEIFQ